MEIARGDVVLLAFPFLTEGRVERKLRPAVVVQAERYNRRRAAIIIAAITSTRSHTALPCKVIVEKDSPAGRKAGLRLDSAVDCRTVATVPRTTIVRRLGRFPPAVMRRIDQALENSLGLAADPAQRD